MEYVAEGKSYESVSVPSAIEVTSEAPIAALAVEAAKRATSRISAAAIHPARADLWRIPPCWYILFFKINRQTFPGAVFRVIDISDCWIAYDNDF